MKSNVKSKTIILITIGIIFALSLTIYNNFNFNVGNSDGSNLDNENLQISALSEKIYIDNNWTDAEVAGICTGSGTYPDPYIIEDLEIDGGGLGSCIKIENSDVFFKIENCTLYNTGTSFVVYGGIQFNNVTNGIIINNNCSSNYNGIYIELSENNTISGNTVNNNFNNGIYLWYSENNTVTGNTVNVNTDDGIYSRISNNNTISGNNASYNGDDGIYVWYSKDISVSGNTVNDNVDDGIFIYDNCKDISVSGNTINDNGDDGIYIWFGNDNIISGNTINNNTSTGIYLVSSNTNQVSGNILLGNSICILEEGSQGNEFSDNGSCTYGIEEAIIPGYNLFVLLGILSVTVILMSKKRAKT